MIKDHCIEQKRETRVQVKFSFEPHRLIDVSRDWTRSTAFKEFQCFPLWFLSQRGVNPDNYTAVLFLFILTFTMEHLPSKFYLVWRGKSYNSWGGKSKQRGPGAKRKGEFGRGWKMLGRISSTFNPFAAKPL